MSSKSTLVWIVMIRYATSHKWDKANVEPILAKSRYQAMRQAEALFSNYLVIPMINVKEIRGCRVTTSSD